MKYYTYVILTWLQNNEKLLQTKKRLFICNNRCIFFLIHKTNID